MHNKLHEAFESIHATEQMKRDTAAFVRQTLSKQQRRKRPLLRYATACCAALLLTLCGGVGYGFYNMPVSYISVDVNPSVELGLNRLDRVVSVESYNDDGALVLENLKLKNKPYTQAVELLLADETLQRYLTEGALLSFTVISDKEDLLLAGIQQCRGYAQNSAECNGASAQLMDEAHCNGLSFGKYQAFLELSQYDKTITPEDCKDLSMRQIRDRICQYTGCGGVPGQGDRHHSGGRGNGYRGGRD